MTPPQHLDDVGHTAPNDPAPGRPHPAGAEWSAPPGAPAAPDSAPGPRRGRLASALIAGAVAGALVAAPTTLVLQDEATPITTAAADEPGEVTAVSASPNGGVDVAGILELTRPAVVAIHTEVVSRTSTGFQRGQAAGSGFVLDADGTIVTNSHVVAGARTIAVEFADGTELGAELVAQDPGRDLAVLSVDGGGDLPALEVGDSAALGVGEPVVAIGNALGLEGDLTVTTGIVSAKERDVEVPGGVTLRGMLQTDAAINPGNSGGPLVDSAGRVVGINTAGALGAQSIGFAMPIDEAMPVIRSLAEGEVPARPFLGVQTVDLDDRVRAEAGIERDDGALVVDVTAGSAAENAQIRAGDVIVAVHGEPVEGSSDLGAVLSRLEPGQTTEVKIDRGGEERTVSVTIGARSGPVA
jgi:serine protease Do